MWLNSMFEIILIMKIYYFESRDRNNLVMRIVLILGFNLIKNHNSYLCLIIFLFPFEQIQDILRFESEGKISWQKQLKYFCYENNFDSGFSIRPKRKTLTLSWKYCCFEVNQLCRKRYKCKVLNHNNTTRMVWSDQWKQWWSIKRMIWRRFYQRNEKRL